MYEATSYDKRFVEILDYLIDTRRSHQLFKTQKKFLESLEIEPHVYPEIRKLRRGIPVDKRDEIIKKLENGYLVNGDYIKYGTLPRFVSAANVMHDDGGSPVYQRLVSPAFDAQKRIKELTDLLKQKDELIEQQKSFIKTLGRTLEEKPCLKPAPG